MRQLVHSLGRVLGVRVVDDVFGHAKEGYSAGAKDLRSAAMTVATEVVTVHIITPAPQLRHPLAKLVIEAGEMSLFLFHTNTLQFELEVTQVRSEERSEILPSIILQQYDGTVSRHSTSNLSRDVERQPICHILMLLLSALQYLHLRLGYTHFSYVCRMHKIED